MGGGEGDSLQLKNGKSGWGTYNRYARVNILKTYNVNNCNIYINLSMLSTFIQQNFNRSENSKTEPIFFSETENFTYSLHKIRRSHARDMRIFPKSMLKYV